MRRELNLAGALSCAGLLGYAWYAQAVLHLDPCPLCIFQRIGVAAAGVLFLLVTLQHPRRLGARLYGVLIVATLLATIGVAARHLWVQAQPPGTVPTCGAGLSYLLQVFPLTDVIRKVLTGSGECARVTWRFLGLTMPAWVLIAAAALLVLALCANFSADRRRA
jgi:disulfide bond formation protein DsbB